MLLYRAVLSTFGHLVGSNARHRRESEEFHHCLRNRCVLRPSKHRAQMPFQGFPTSPQRLEHLRNQSTSQTPQTYDDSCSLSCTLPSSNRLFVVEFGAARKQPTPGFATRPRRGQRVLRHTNVMPYGWWLLRCQLPGMMPLELTPKGTLGECPKEQKLGTPQLSIRLIHT